MYVYVLNKHGKPLMPCKPRKARVLLQSGKATVIKKTPFTIQLKYGSSGYKQPISLGVDAGSKHIGVAATTETKVLYAEELEPRNDVVKLLSVRRQNRRTRRSHKTRYRQVRFNNRVHSKHKGWLAPSVEVKIQEHISAIKRVQAILPITEVHVETAEFDTQRLKALRDGNPLPVGTDYQLGELYDSYNVRQYVLKRDNYTCQCCGAKNVKLHVHHKESRKTGSEAPWDKITLCEDCHEGIHLGTKTLPDKKAKPSKSLRDAAFMGIMRQTLLDRLRNQLDIPATGTYGYITKMYRERYNIEKSHINDAIVISKNFKATPNGTWYKTKAVRHHNRQIHKNTIQKGGYRKLNQAPHVVKGFRLFDKVIFKNQKCFIFGRRSSGSFDVRTLDGTKISACAGYKKLRILETAKSVLFEERSGSSSPTVETGGFPA